MSRGNKRRFSSNADYPDRGRGSSRGPVSGSRAGGAGGGTEPKRFDRWYTPNWRERAETDRAVFRNGLAAFAIVATEFREYMETEYGVPMTMDDAVSFVDTHGLKEYNE